MCRKMHMPDNILILFLVVLVIGHLQHNILQLVPCSLGSLTVYRKDRTFTFHELHSSASL